MTKTRDLNTIAERYSHYGVIKEELSKFVKQGIAKGYDEKTFLFIIDKILFLVLVKGTDIETAETLKSIWEVRYKDEYIKFINGEYLECDLLQEDNFKC